MRMQLVRGEQPLEMLLFEPDALVPDRAPEEDQRLGVEQSTLMRQLIELGSLADVDTSYLVHLQAFLSGNVPLNRFLAHLACCGSKVRACPQRRQFARLF